MMPNRPSLADLQRALAAAASAHHEYEQNARNGVRDEQWAGWYAAYVLGRLGDFTSPSSLTHWMENVEGEGEWSATVAKHVDAQLRDA